MEPIDFWQLCSAYTIVQATLIIAGSVPDDLEDYVENNVKKRPIGYVAIRTALYRAIRSGELIASIEYFEDNFGNDGGINPHETTIHVRDLDAFLKSWNMLCPFFDRPELVRPGALTPQGQKFPRKLDAAIKAWTAVSNDPVRLRGKSPKQALEGWLMENASDLGLLNKDGRPNKGGIEEICKVANWKPEGGATCTPSAEPIAPKPQLITVPDVRAAARHERFAADLDDEIPF